MLSHKKDSRLLNYELDSRLSPCPSERESMFQKEEGSGHTLPDLNHPEQEILHDYPGSFVEETQSELLEPETQFDDHELSLASQKATVPQQTYTAVRDVPVLQPIVSGIERPRSLDQEDNATGFKFSKAPQPSKPGQYCRLPGKQADANHEFVSKEDITDLARSEAAAGATSDSSLPLPPSTNAHSREAVNSRKNIRTGIGNADAPSTTSASATHQKVVPEPSPKGLQNTWPSTPKINQFHIPTKHKLALGDIIENDGPSKDSHNPPISVQAQKEQPSENFPQRHENAKNQISLQLIPVPSFSTIAIDSQPHYQPSASDTALPNSFTKSHKNRVIRQPFPDVFPPRRDSGRIAAMDQHVATATDNLLRLVDVNTAVAKPAPIRAAFPYQKELVTTKEMVKKPFPMATDTFGAEAMLSISRDNAHKYGVIARNNSSECNESSGEPPDAMSSSPPHLHQDKIGKEQAQVLAILGPVMAPPSQYDGGGVLPPQSTHTSLDQCAGCEIQVDHEGDPLQSASQPLSRPDSALSNTAKLRTRPLGPDDLLPPVLSERAAPTVKHPMKVQKSKNNLAHITRKVKAWPQADAYHEHPLDAISGFRGFLQHLPSVEDALQDYIEQKAILALQQDEIEKLNLFNRASKTEIQRLEEEKDALITKVKKFEDVSVRYKSHMNDVVQAQKHLLGEQKKFRIESTELRKQLKAALEAHADRENQERRLQALISKARDDITSCKKMQEMEVEKENYKTDVEKLERTNQLLQSELNAIMVDLSRERHNTEQLQNHLNAQSESHRDLVTSMERAQKTIVYDLTKEGSIWAKGVSSEKLILKKIDDLYASFNTVENRESILPSALIKLHEELYTRIEAKLQVSEKQDVTRSDYHLQLLKDVKERIDQLRLDDATKVSLNDRIDELTESNASLTAGKVVWESECEVMAKRFDETQRDLSGCQFQLKEKSDELAALRALPKEDQIVRAHMHDLENAKMMLENQMDVIAQEASEVKAELASSRKTAISAGEESHRLQVELTEAQNFLRNLLEEKEKYLGTRKTSIEKACQEIAKRAYAAKLEAKLQYDCLAKNLEQRRYEAEKGLELSQKEVQKYREERDRNVNIVKNLQEELSLCNKRLAQQSAYVNSAELGVPSRDEYELREGRLQQAIANITEIKVHFEAAQKAIAHRLGVAIDKYHNEDKDLVKKIDNSQTERDILGGQKLGTRKTYGEFEAYVDQDSRQSGVLLGAKLSVGDWTVEQMHSPDREAVPTLPIAKCFTPQQPTSKHFDLSLSHAKMKDSDDFSFSVQDITKDIFHPNELRLRTITQGTRGLQSSTDSPADIAAGSKHTKSNVTPNSVQPVEVGSTILGADSALSKITSSQYQGSPKPLRSANRRSSGLRQSAPVQEVTTTTNIRDIEIVSAEALPTKVGERALALPVQSDTATTPAGSYHGLHLGGFPNSVKDPSQTGKLAVFSPNTGAIEHHPMVTLIQTNAASFAGAALLQSSSPLSDLEPSIASLFDELTEYEKEELQKTNLVTKSRDIKIAAETGSIGGDASATQSLTADTVAGVKFKDAAATFQVFDDIDVCSASASLKTNPQLSVTDESARRRRSQPLKSALKKSKAADTDSIQDTQDSFQVPAFSPRGPIVPKMVSHAITNKQQPLTRMDIASSYNRTASGFKSGGSSRAPIGPPTARKQSAKQTVVNGEKSPLMRAPTRNARKRPAEGVSEPMKPLKQPRLSLRFPKQAQKEDRIVVPDSQDHNHS